MIVGSHADLGFSWYRKGPLKACVIALRLKAHTAEAAILFLDTRTEGKRKEENQFNLWSIDTFIITDIKSRENK